MFGAYLYIFFVSFLLCFLITRPVIRLSFRFRLLDVADDEKKTHEGEVPLLGGMAVFSSFILVVFLHILIPWILLNTRSGDWIPANIKGFVEGAVAQLPLLVPIAGGGLVFFLIGLLDDMRKISVSMRFLLEFATTGALIMTGVRLGLGFLPD